MDTYYAKLTAGPEGGYGIQFPGIPSHIKPEGGRRDPPMVLVENRAARIEACVP